MVNQTNTNTKYHHDRQQQQQQQARGSKQLIRLVLLCLCLKLSLSSQQQQHNRLMMIGVNGFTIINKKYYSNTLLNNKAKNGVITRRARSSTKAIITAAFIVSSSSSTQERHGHQLLHMSSEPYEELELIEQTIESAVFHKQKKKEPSEEPPSLVQREYNTWEWRDTYQINYRSEGPIDGPPTLLIHGFGANVNHFRFQFPVLTQLGYRVHAIDLLGFGASDKPPEESYCIELWGEQLVHFIQYIQEKESLSDDKQWIVGGNSIGGLCSLLVATKLPDVVRGVILFNCAGGMTSFRYEELPFFLRPILWFVQNVVLKGSWGASFFQNFKSPENVENILKTQGVYRNTTNVDSYLLELLLGPSDDPGAQDVFLKVFGGPPGPTPESLLPKVKSPILALWGDADPWTPLDGGLHPGSQFGKYVNAQTTKFTLVALPNTGHCPHDEAPDLCHDAMIPWLNKLNE